MTGSTTEATEITERNSLSGSVYSVCSVVDFKLTQYPTMIEPRLDGGNMRHVNGGLMTKVFAVSLALAALLPAGSLSAHHSPSAVFDMSKPFTLKGTLTKVEWVNPHIDILVDAAAADGSTETWKFESNPPSWFKHVGLTRADFAKFIGQSVTIGGVRARDGSNYGYMRKFTFPGGNSIELEVGGGEAKP
jgi:hypothetical protein